VPAESVGLGQHVLVRPGEQVPLDGVITWGTANLSLQHISGEARPVRLSPGQEVPAGVCCIRMFVISTHCSTFACYAALHSQHISVEAQLVRLSPGREMPEGACTTRFLCVCSLPVSQFALCCLLRHSL
jgi:hypothetical protein